MAERYSSFADGGRMWLFQRVTAAFLILVLAFHFFQLHFVIHAADITFQGTQARMERPLYYLTMILFLITATFHGVNGVYNALINQGLNGSQRTAVKWILIAASVGLIIQGIRVANVMAGVTIG